MIDKEKDDDHWLARPETIKKLWIAFIAILVLLVVGDFFAHHHPYFVLDGYPAFGAVFGFLASLVLVGIAKVVGALLKRSDTYYDS